MKPYTIIRHRTGSIGLRLCGLGPRFIPCRGIKQIQQLFEENTTWAKKRSIKNIKKMLKNSDSVISLWRERRIIGFGRATTDEIYRATLWDVVIKKEEQGSGFGKIIINALLTSNQLKNVEKVYLMTSSSTSFYRQCGFKQVKNQTLMLIKEGDLSRQLLED